MMKIEDILEEWKKDCAIDDTELSRESLNIPYLHSKYLKKYTDARLKYKALEKKLSKTKLLLSEYYKGDLNSPEELEKIGREPWPRAVLKSELMDYIESDDEFIQVKNKIDYYEEVKNMLQEIIKSINTRNFVIKNAIDWNKFINGS